MAAPSTQQRPALVAKELRVPFLLLLLCFAAWGTAANLTDVLVGVFRSIFTMTILESSLVQFAYYGAYFLLAIPAVLLSGFYMLLFKREPMTPDQWGMTLAATFVAFVVGYAVIVWFMRLISHKGFTFFVVYRVVLGLLILAGLYFGLIQ